MVEPVSVSLDVTSSTVFSLRKEEPHGTEDLGSVWSSSGESNCAYVRDDTEQICLALFQSTSVPLSTSRLFSWNSVLFSWHFLH